MHDYNGLMGGWAAYIVLQRLRYVQFPAWQGPASVPKARFYELPDTEFRRWLIEKDAPYANLPAGKDQDGQPAITILRPDYILEGKSVSFSHWITAPQTAWQLRGRVPVFKKDPRGRALVINKASSAVATAEFWRAMNNPAAW